MKISLSIFIIAMMMSVNLYALSPDTEAKIPFRLAQGKVLFQKNCSQCHGNTMTGTDKGPPLIHSFYKPSHHGDSAFYNAAINGVKAHHWNFGDMPAVPNMNEKKMRNILPYIRFYQKQQHLY